MRKGSKVVRADWKDTHVGSVQFGDARITIEMHHGRFHARFAGESIGADTADELLEKMRVLARKQKVRIAIPITLTGWMLSKQLHRSHWCHGAGVRHATITGRHARTGVILARTDDGETIQLNRREEQVKRRLSPEESERWITLHRAKCAANDAMYHFERKIGIGDLDEVVDAAITAAVDTVREPDEESADPRLQPAAKKGRRATARAGVPLQQPGAVSTQEE